MTANDTIKTVNEMTSKGVDRFASLGEVNLRSFEQVAARQFDAVNVAMDYGVRMMKLATDSKRYEDFFKGQIQATKELSERVMSESKTNLDVATQLRDEYRTWFEKNMADLSADLRKGAVAA